MKKHFKSTITFNQGEARKFCKMEYYIAQKKNLKHYEAIEIEKNKLATPRTENVTRLLSLYKNIGKGGWASPAGLILKGIYNKNKESATLGNIARNSNLLKVVAKPEVLLLAYRAIRSNRGALTKAAEISLDKLNTFDEIQKKQYFKSNCFPDKIGLADFFAISKLLLRGKYPWGSSRRIYFPKPGVLDKKRPITIPYGPFMDRVVQKAFTMVLEAVYEPYFEKRNRSFGFRPNKGVQDAISAVTSLYSSGKITAIEGDVEAAYDTVNKQKLIKILSERISDRKFLNLMFHRLDYDYVEITPEGKIQRIKPKLGIPQGGIDSPYLFNIYMNKLDDYVHTELQDFVNNLNKEKAINLYLLKQKIKNRKAGPHHSPIFLPANPKPGSKINTLVLKRTFSLESTVLRGKRQKCIRHQQKIKLALKQATDQISITELREKLYNEIKIMRKLNHKFLSVKTTDPCSSVEIKILYVRYADDWILLTNGSTKVAALLKNKISTYLKEELGLILSEKKTIITDIRINPAKFLGFELKVKSKDPNSYKKFNTQRKKGSTIIWSTPDKQRLINRLHMKGFCDASGFPRELPWLATIEPHVIIERYNAVMRGFAQFYFGFIRNPSDISRWIYIFRYSCFKTLAQKYKTTISGVFKRFGHLVTDTKRKTVRFTVLLKVGSELLERHWDLLSYYDLKKLVLKDNKQRKLELQSNFWEIEKDNKIGEYPIPTGKIPTVTNEEYLDSISWVSLRTQASFAMPCANCGSFEDVHQHHVKHVRKRAYCLIPDDISYQKIMVLRNRKQIPLCKECHIKLVHSGKYDGEKLINLSPIKKLSDNRVLHVESFVHPGIEHYSKPLTERGWTIVQNKGSLFKETKKTN